jgi:hypothetical protein
MPDEPRDDLLDHLLDGPLATDRIAAHLDTWPLPVDEHELAIAVAALEGRMGRRRPVRRGWAVAASTMLVAAGLLVWLWPSTRTRTLVPTQPGVTVHQLVAPGGSLRVPLDTRLDLLEPTVLTTAASSEATVTLVQEGTVTVEGTLVPEGHWAITGPGEPVVFADGHAPPPLNPDVWQREAIDAQLRAARFETLEEATRAVLTDLLMEDR